MTKTMFDPKVHGYKDGLWTCQHIRWPDHGVTQGEHPPIDPCPWCEIERLQAQLPEEMKHCTIQFKECEKGHGRLTATNWIDHGCQSCEIEQLRAALKVAQQSLLEFSHAQESGPSWYTRGENGMYQQVRLWLRRGLAAVQGALGPYDDNGQYLKERPAAEPSAPQSEQLPINRALVHALGFCVIPLRQGSVTVENRSPDPVVVTVDRATERRNVQTWEE